MMQIITIAGNIGGDAEVKQTQKGDAYAAFSVGVSKGRDSDTTWYRVALFGVRGEKLAQYLTKGSKVTVIGELNARLYDDKTGAKKLSLDVRASEVALQGGGQKQDAPRERHRETSARGTDWSNAGPDDFSDDIPF